MDALGDSIGLVCIAYTALSEIKLEGGLDRWMGLPFC